MTIFITDKEVKTMRDYNGLDKAALDRYLTTPPEEPEFDCSMCVFIDANHKSCEHPKILKPVDLNEEPPCKGEFAMAIGQVMDGLQEDAMYFDFLLDKSEEGKKISPDEVKAARRIYENLIQIIKDAKVSERQIQASIDKVNERYDH